MDDDFFDRCVYTRPQDYKDLSRLQSIVDESKKVV
jgi:hypothetical protein